MIPILAILNISALLQMLIYLAIVGLIIWGIFALLRHFGLAIPQPVMIVLYVLAGVALILFLARAFGVAV